KYYIRVYSQSSGFPASKAGFSISVKHIAPPPPPSNDECSAATTLTSNTICSNISSTLSAATKSTVTTLGCVSASDQYDVWFKFTGAATNQTISLSSVGSGITNPAIQLYSGTCGSLTSIQCGTTSLTNSSLTIGNTYFVRVSQVGSVPSGTVAFSICVTHPAPPPAPPANDECSSATSLTVGTT